MKKSYVFFLVSIFALIPVRPGLGAEVKLGLRVGFGNCVVPDTLTPVIVEFNQTPVEGRIEIIRPGSEGAFTIIESFPAQNVGRIETPVFVNDKINDLKIRLLSGRQVMVETGLNRELKVFPGNLVLLVKAPAAQQAIEQALQPAEPVLAAPVRLEELPCNALSYDGISGLVISDPGPVLTPSQIQALKNWLAGGGRMVLGTARSGENSLLWELGIDVQDGGRGFYKIGFGGVTALRDDFDALKLEASEWRSFLNLRPYTEKKRLTLQSTFPEDQFGSSREFDGKSTSIKLYLGIILILWVVTILLIIVPTNRRLFLLIGFSLIWMAGAFPLGVRLRGIWNRGAVISSYSILLPEVGQRLSNVGVSFGHINEKRMNSFNYSPWGGKVSFGADGQGRVGGINSTGTFRWSHRRGVSRTDVRSAGPGWVILNGWFDWQNQAETKTGFGKETVVWDGRYFYPGRHANLAGHEREGLRRPPDWILKEHEWLNRLKRFSPDTIWLIGRTSWGENGIKIEDEVFTGELWAMPLREEVRR